MEYITIILIATSLAMDTTAVSIVSGSIYRQLHIRHSLRMAFFFGAFQAIMPTIGWWAGQGFSGFISSYDHIVAFGLLLFIGSKMIYESLKIKEAQQRPDPANIMVVLGLSIATSIDALAVGITLSLITTHIGTAVLIIGAVTFLMSWTGCWIGRKFGHFFENRIEIIGGLILIAIGIKTLLQHTLYKSF